MRERAWIPRIAAALFAAAGICAAGAAIGMGLTSMESPPVLVKVPENAQSQVSIMMARVCRGDYDGASALMLGTPSLGAGRTSEEEGGELLWDAFVESISYELVGDCYATNDGISQDVRITSLELDSVTEPLRQRVQDILQQRLETAEDVSQIYDENNNFREDVVMEAYLEAVEQAIEEDASTTSTTVSVKLAYDAGQWWIVPETALLEAISGGILK